LSFNLNQWDEWFRKVWEIWLLKLPQGGLVLTFLNGTTGEIVMQLILSCNSKTIFYKGKKILKYNNNKYCIVILYGFKMYLLCNMCFHWLLLTVNKNVRTNPPCGNFSNHISQTFLNHSSHWFKLNDVMQVLRLFHWAS
jgi:hypothetical protein